MSRSWIDRALDAIPGGSSTSAKSPVKRLEIDSPAVFAVSGEGAHFNDQEKRRWLDIDMGMGSVVWGHGRREIADAIGRQAAVGTNLSAPSTLEILLAERLLERYQQFDQIRFCKDGSDATSAAVRAARAATGRDGVVLGTYHGWHDWSLCHPLRGSASGGGIPRPIASGLHWLPAESFDSLMEIVPPLPTPPAAVILCPEHWRPAELSQARRWCDKMGCLLIFDEVKSSLRYGKSGVAGALTLKPDLLCIGKGLANGLPLAAVMGDRALMGHLEEVGFSSTHSGESISLAAALAAEALLSEQSVWPSWGAHSERMMTELGAVLKRFGLVGELEVTGYPGAFAVESLNPKERDAFRRYFNQGMSAHGIYSLGWVVMSHAHREREADAILEACVELLGEYRATKERERG